MKLSLHIVELIRQALEQDYLELDLLPLLLYLCQLCSNQ